MRDDLALNARVTEAQSFVGGGSAPSIRSRPWPSRSRPLFRLLLIPRRAGQALRQGETPVITRVQKGQVLFDLRTVALELEPSLIEAIRESVPFERVHGHPLVPFTRYDKRAAE